MNTKQFLCSMAVAVTAGVVLSSCGKEENVYNPDMVYETAFTKYETSFIQQYGPINPNETWDFSKRGSTLAGAVQTRGKKSSNYLDDWRGDQSYGYVWHYSDKSGETEPMPENEVNDLFNNHWANTILPAITAAQEIEWNPSGSVIFRELATTRTDGSSNKYFAIGIDDGESNLYLRMSSPDNGKGAKRGTTGDQHASSLDFSKIPSNAIWYACATTAQNKNKIEINASDFPLTYFKEVTVTINNKAYTFWCFKCDPSDAGTYADMVLWVQKVPNVPSMTECKRFMVEDLGDAYDKDFNDVVFDVATFSDGRKVCYVRALGGTLDVTIHIGNEKWTKSSKYNKKQMYNTEGTIDYDANLAEFEVPSWNGMNTSISVDVETQDGSYYGVPFPDPGNVPCITACRDGKQWRKERSQIPSTEWFTLPNE